MGQSRRFDLLSITSGLPPTSDVFGPNRHFAFVPIADIGTRQTIDTENAKRETRFMDPLLFVVGQSRRHRGDDEGQAAGQTEDAGSHILGHLSTG